MTDAMTSESSDVNVSSSVDETTAEMDIRSLAGQVSPNVIIVRVTILLVLTVFNLGGNGFTLITIRLTPRLWTKTNFILASMLVADVITGVLMFWYIPFLLVVFVFNNPCQYSVAFTATMPLLKVTGYVSFYHLILVSVERYIAIVYPLHYETKFTDRTVKWAIFTIWVTGIIVSMMWLLWLINVDVRKCDPIPGQYYVIEVFVFYIPVCITMFTCYGKILLISWRHRRRIELMNPAAAASAKTMTMITVPATQRSKADKTEDPKHNMAGTGTAAKSTVTSGTASAESAEEQQRKKIKSQSREFKAVYLTGAIVGVFILLWFPTVLGRVLALVGYNSVVVNYLHLAGGAIGVLNYSFTWALYAAVSRSYRRAYRQTLYRIGCCCCKNVTLQADNSVLA